MIRFQKKIKNKSCVSQLTNESNTNHRKDNNCLGARGETLAVQYLKKQHCRIVARNFQTVQGEIDIIARHGNCISFIEVKTRKCDDVLQQSFGSAAASVNLKKQNHMVLAARQYLRMYPVNARPQFDVMEVYLSQNARTLLLQCDQKAVRRFQDARIVWIQNAFLYHRSEQKTSSYKAKAFWDRLKR